MPTVVLVGGKDHKVLFSTLDFSTSDTTVMRDKILALLGTNGIKDLPVSVSAFNVFPNPVNDFVELHFSANEKREISIVNVLGNQLHAETTTVNNVTVNTYALARGIYFITVKTANGKTSTKKIIKN